GRRFDIVVLSDYAKGAIGPDLLNALASAREREPFVWVVDPKRANFAHYRRASLVKPNREEASEASGIEIRDRATLCAAGERLLSRWDADAVLVSRGEEGMALFRRGGGGGALPTAAREGVGATGAGDTARATRAVGDAAGRA